MTLPSILAITALQTIVNASAPLPEEPLRDVRAYSLEIDESGNGTDGFYGIELPEARRARFVRLSFACNPDKTTWLDEIWIFGRLPREADNVGNISDGQ